MKKLKSKNLKGFTLIEILLATSILVMVGVAAIGVERNFMASAGVNKHKLQATALAQEGINAVRAAYNTKLLNNDTSGLAAGTYIINADDSLSPGTNQTIQQNNVNFTRTITVP
ncbi:MAG: type II secretion system GspH family protein [Patescibacteria group bacterium]|nr:type II secretion system GspH family protein [Patescibacteria group bacterium]